MFKHILMPTDGSPLSDGAVEKGMQFARSIGARVTGLHVIDPFHLLGAEGEIPADSKERYERDSRAHARRALAVILEAAKTNGVLCDCVSETSSIPCAVIVEVAEKKGCDLITMASHGRRGGPGRADRERDGQGTEPHQDPRARPSLNYGRRRRTQLTDRQTQDGAGGPGGLRIIPAIDCGIALLRLQMAPETARKYALK